MRHAVHRARRQFKKTDWTIKVDRLIGLVGPSRRRYGSVRSGVLPARLQLLLRLFSSSRSFESNGISNFDVDAACAIHGKTANVFPEFGIMIGRTTRE
jgi:hypothetical protein